MAIIGVFSYAEERLSSAEAAIKLNTKELSFRETTVFEVTSRNSLNISHNTEKLNIIYSNQRVICHALHVDCE